MYTLFTWFSHIANIPNGYYISENYIIKIKDRRFIIFKDKNINVIECESLLYEEIKKRKKDHILKFRKYIINSNKHKNQNKSQIWIINDTIDKARDNGEYFFRYLNNKNNEGLKVYFVISKNCTVLITKGL